ncbi:hypothetical protein PGB90_008702 [Kerria lacca]
MTSVISGTALVISKEPVYQRAGRKSRTNCSRTTNTSHRLRVTCTIRMPEGEESRKIGRSSVYHLPRLHRKKTLSIYCKGLTYSHSDSNYYAVSRCRGVNIITRL